MLVEIALASPFLDHHKMMARFNINIQRVRLTPFFFMRFVEDMQQKLMDEIA